MKLKFNILMLLSITILLSCAHDKMEFVDFDESSLDMIESSFRLISESDCDADDLSLWETVDMLSFTETGTKATYTNVAGIASGILSCFTYTKLHQVVGTYTSHDLKGNPITVSGKVVYPKDGKIKNIIVVSHWTIGSNAEAPSQGFSLEGLLATKGYAVVMADYIGFGVTVDKVHPYLQAVVCAENVLDFALAARPFLKKRGIVPESDEVILFGYSQGGATSLHCQRLIENRDYYGQRFHIKQNYCGAGPYNIARTYDQAVKVNVTGIPCAIPMIVQGMSIGMDRPLDMDYFFQEPLLSHYQDWLNSKKYTVSQMSKLIGSDSLSNILTSNALIKTNEETIRFYRELLQNSIPNSYHPEAPLLMFHSEDDETVPFVNSQLMQRQFRYDDNVDYDFGHYGSHQQGAVKFLFKVLKLI
ncbi:MAG: hypothetical protein IJS02_03760 [Bacteroidales bacterium]|nr:hypothetical protein [Bacteroidales bacterium]